MPPTLDKQIAEVKSAFDEASGPVDSEQQLEQLRIRFVGKKGSVTALFKQMGQLPPEDRPLAGKSLNALKNHVQDGLATLGSTIATGHGAIADVDVTLPGTPIAAGHAHPLMQILDEVKSIFRQMGFVVESGPEAESDYYNFEALNIPAEHPARDMQDTFYLPDDLVLRTHTSPVQIRTMERQKPPVRIIAPGRCFRRDTPDATHSPMFHQVEGLVVDEHITMADLKGVLTALMRQLFGGKTEVRFRPSFFPFTEPSAEYDVSCPFCQGNGCRVCKQAGWIEISGAGMVDPAVFGFVGYDPERYSGYAFGMGLERIAMLRCQIDDIRTFFDNDIRFLQQFR